MTMARTKNYVAVYEHDAEEDVWLVHIKGIEGVATYGRSIRQAQGRIREALAAWLDREPETLNITPEMPRDFALVASKVSQARSDAERAGSMAQATAAKAVQELSEAGLSRRDAAELLGISHQRVQQFLEKS